MYQDFLVDEPSSYPGSEPFPGLDYPGMTGMNVEALTQPASFGYPDAFDFASYTQGLPTLTVSQYLRRPDLLYRRMTDIAEKGFIIDALLRGGYDVSGGVIPYTRSESIYLDRNPEQIPEGGPYPVSGDTPPPVLQEVAKKYGLKTFITEEMVRRNQFPQVEVMLTKLTNTIIKYIDGIFLNRLTGDTAVLTRAAAAAWTATTTTMLQDIENAKADIRLQFEGYEPDTLIINPSKVASLTSNTQLATAYQGNMAVENPVFTGQLPPLFGLDIMYTPNIASNTAIVCDRTLMGGRGDEVPMEVKALPFDEHFDRFWLKGRRVVATFLQEPKAVNVLTGL